MPHINDLILGEGEISETPRSNMFYLNLEGEEIGPFKSQDLKEHMLSDPKANSFLVRNVDESKFTPLFEHQAFQRREKDDSQIDSFNESTDKLYILINSTKSGPFKVDEVLEKLSRKEILVNDHISWDEGQSWHKLYTISHFDRRSKKAQDDLPHVPDVNLSEKPRIPAQDNLDESEESVALANLAYISNLKSGKAKQSELSQTAQIEEKKPEPVEVEESDIPTEENKRSIVLISMRPSLFFLWPVFHIFF